MSSFDPAGRFVYIECVPAFHHWCKLRQTGPVQDQLLTFYFKLYSECCGGLKNQQSLVDLLQQNSVGLQRKRFFLTSGLRVDSDHEIISLQEALVIRAHTKPGATCTQN